jgi:Doubled CXXCH motif (Paired_CXXCH_1)
VNERPSRRRRWGIGLAVPLVVVLVLALLAVGTLRRGDSAPSPTPLPPTVTTSTFLYCGDCHGDLDKVFKDGKYPNLTFTHDQHFGIGVSDCAACHVANTHEPDKINRPTMVTCYQCHALGEDARAPGRCTLCHPATLDPEPASHRAEGWVPELHPVAAKEDPFSCTTCHQQSFCNSCHGLELPHPAGWNELPHAQAFFNDPALCEKCHPREPLVERDTCDTCHHPQGPDSTTWIQWHPNVVKDRGAETCFQCHATDTCRVCHRQGTENFTDEDLAADEALLETSPVPGITPPATPPATPTASPTPTG